MPKKSKYRRVVLKLSGEALAGTKGYGIDPAIVDSVAKQIKETVSNGLQVAVVVGFQGGGHQVADGCVILHNEDQRFIHAVLPPPAAR